MEEKFTVPGKKMRTCVCIELNDSTDFQTVKINAEIKALCQLTKVLENRFVFGKQYFVTLLVFTLK